MPRCGAERNGEGPCRQEAGYGTPHPGYGRCKFHTGSTRFGIIQAAKVEAGELLTALPDGWPQPDAIDPLVALSQALGTIAMVADQLQRLMGWPLTKDAVVLGEVTAQPLYQAWERAMAMKIKAAQTLHTAGYEAIHAGLLAAMGTSLTDLLERVLTAAGVDPYAPEVEAVVVRELQALPAGVRSDGRPVDR